MDKKINALRQFFTISVAAFEMQQTISIAFGYRGKKSNMHRLHAIAKEEIEKDQPDLTKIDNLIAMMENLARENSKQ